MWLGYFLDAAVTLLIRDAVRQGVSLDDAAQQYAEQQRGKTPVASVTAEPVDAQVERSPRRRAARNDAAFAALERMMGGVKR